MALLAGVQLRRGALESAILLAAFATAMTLSSGIKSALDGSVYSASAAALLLALAPPAGRGRDDRA